MGRCATLYGSGYDGGMMHGGGGVKEGRIRAVGDDSYSMQTRASTDDVGHHRPTAAVGPHSPLSSIQQSTKITM